MDFAETHLLDFSKDFDVTLLDQIILIAYDGKHPNRSAANDFLVRMKDHPDMWKRADAILESSKQSITKQFGLQILESAICTRWKILPLDQREGIRNYVISKIMALSSDENTSKIHEINAFLSRLNLVLVQILKQDWPANWPNFISDIVGSSKSSESLCTNNLKILRLLSEEVFDYSFGNVTSSKLKTLKESLNSEFAQIFGLCEFILGASPKVTLIQETLKTLQRFITWIPLGYIFETQLIPTLIGKYFSETSSRIASLDCLIEIATLESSEIPDVYNEAVERLLMHFIHFLLIQIPEQTDYSQAFETGSEIERLFIARLALFFATFLQNHIKKLSSSANIQVIEALFKSLDCLIKLSYVSDDEIFRTCLEFWYSFAKDLHAVESQWKVSSSFQSATVFNANAQPRSSLFRDDKRYGDIIHRVRKAMIENMAKPEEVIVVVDENGDIVREMAKDTDIIAQYKTMKDTIVYLTHLNYEDTEQIMLHKLAEQVDGGLFAWGSLNTLCWAIGSMSMAMHEGDEKRFLVTVIRDLLRLCEVQKGKENKAVIATNIMYIVGQYPRFLRAHWKFLKTVVNKLFEFMHEYHPGVQDMACDTFLKIAQKCKRKFVTLQADDLQPFIVNLINDLPSHTKDLQPHQIQSFYESVACMISDKGSSVVREKLILMLTNPLNIQWQHMMDEAKNNVNHLIDLNVIREIGKILRSNIKICNSAGSIYVHQLSTIFTDAMNIYRLYGESISTACRSHGEIAVRYTNNKAMKSVKADILELITSFIDVSYDLEDKEHILLQKILPPLMQEVLIDYKTSPPPARDAKVLTLFASAITALRHSISSSLPMIMEAIFEPSLQLITQNMTDYPEHRFAFFKFLREANDHCFHSLFSISPEYQKLVVESIVWAFKHTERNISETGLEILHELILKMRSEKDIAQGFFQQFLLSLIQDVMGILTDRLHKSGFAHQANVLKLLFHIVETGQVTAPLYDTAARPGIDNSAFLKDHVSALIISAFPNLTKTQVIAFVVGLFDVNLNAEAFKQHLRDFMVSVKEFESEDNSDLFLEETEAKAAQTQRSLLEYRSSIPGLMKPAELDDDPDL